jgi:hypothetical protein
MRRHVIIGRFGPSDTDSVSTAPEETPTRLEFVTSGSRLEHGIGEALDDLMKMNVFPTEVGVDLLVLAAHVQAADTRISRTTESQDNWTREIHIVVPVSDVNRWNATTLMLGRLLNFLTGDYWTVQFRPRPNGFDTIVNRGACQLAGPPFDFLTLFSGGLDSLIGSITSLEHGQTPLLISHAAEGATSSSQATLFRKLKNYYPARMFDRLRIWMTFPDGLVSNVASENTTRGRSFLFVATGVFAGTGLNRPFILRVPENGFIAINVPLDQLRLGALSTRTTHPFYIARWNDFLAALGISGQIENPYWDKTKGDMIEACPNRALLTSLIPDALSCSSPTKGRWQGQGIGHCGYCLPCLIRRAAILRGLGSPDPTSYGISELSGKTLNSQKADGQQIRSFQFAIERLRRRPNLASLLIHKPGPLFDESPARQSTLAEVYGRGLSEVAVLLTNVCSAPS